MNEPNNFKLPFSVMKILSQAEAQDIVLAEPKKWNVASIVSADGAYYKRTGKIIPLDKPNFKKAKTFKQVHFDDIQKEIDYLVLCNKWHIEVLLDYAKKHYDEPLIVHCHAGISRSSAITFLILLDRLKETSENPVEDALTLLIGVKNWNLIFPNKYIIGLGMHILAKDAGQEIEWNRIFYNSRIISKLYA